MTFSSPQVSSTGTHIWDNKSIMLLCTLPVYCIELNTNMARDIVIYHRHIYFFYSILRGVQIYSFWYSKKPRLSFIIEHVFMFTVNMFGIDVLVDTPTV